jgi:hypothetical protein
MRILFASAVAVFCAAACSGSDGRDGSPSKGPAQVVLAISVQGEGTVKAAGGDCRGTCAQRYTAGEHVTLAAVADGGVIFSGWSGGCQGKAGCELVLDKDLTVSATFARADSLRRQVTVLVDGRGKILSSPSGIDCGASCSASYDEGTTVALTATPEAGYAFSAWSGGCSGQADCRFQVSGSNTVVGAKFEALPPPPPQMAHVTVQVNGAGSVRSIPAGVDCGPLCSATFNVGDTVSLVAAAAPGNRFMGWSGACTGTDALCRLLVASDAVVVAAQFEAEVVTLIDGQYYGYGSAVNSKDVFWQGWSGYSYEIRAIPKMGGTLRSVVTLPLGSALGGFLAADEDWVFYIITDSTQRPKLFRAPASGGSAVALADAYSVSSGIVTDDTNVYWLGGVCCGAGTVMTMPKAGGVATSLSPMASPGSSIAVDASDVYFSSYYSGIYRVSKKGSLSEPVITCGGGWCGWYGIKLDETFVYYRDNNGAVYAKVKGSNAFFNVSHGNGEVQGADFEVSGSTVYWLSYNALYSARFDGTDVKRLDGGSVRNLRLDDKYSYYIVDGRLTRRLK